MNKETTFVPGKTIPDGTKTPDRFGDLYRWLPHDKRITIFDVGSNVGDMTRKFREMFPFASIHCFEPTPVAFQKLKWRLKQDEAVILNNVAVAETDGEMRFFVNEDFNKVNSLLQRNRTQSKYYRYDVQQHIDVKTISLDRYCSEKGVGNINLLKLDIQGGEVSALKGASNLLQHQAIDIILSEILFVELYEGGAVFYELSAFLAQYGYTVYHLYDLHRAENGQITWGDAIFVSLQYRRKGIDKKKNLLQRLIPNLKSGRK